MSTDDIFAVQAARVPDTPEKALGDAVGDGQAIQRAQDRHGYTTAIMVQRPRILAQVESRVLDEARRLGESAYYGWGAGKNQIEGPTIKLAMRLVANWGNAVVDMLPVQETESAYIFAAAFVDLETGFTLTRQFRQSKKWLVHGKHDAERKEDIRFQIGQSKAVRNVVLNAVPGWLVDKAVAAAKEGVLIAIQAYIDAHGIEKARAVLVGEFKKQSIAPERVASKMNRATIEGLTLEDMVTLKGDLRALRDGAERADSLFPEPGPSVDSEKLRANLAATRPTPEPPPANETTTNGPPPPETMPGTDSDQAIADLHLRQACTAKLQSLDDDERASAMKNLGLECLYDLKEMPADELAVLAAAIKETL